MLNFRKMFMVSYKLYAQKHKMLLVGLAGLQA